MKNFLLSFLTFFALTLSVKVNAQGCGYNANVGTFTAALNDNTQVLEHGLSLLRTSNSTPNCSNFRVYFGKGNANSYERKAFSGSNGLSYNLYRTVGLGDMLKDFPDAGPGEFIAGNLPSSNTSFPQSFFVSLPNMTTVFALPPGVYTDVVPINFYAVRNNGAIEFQTARFLTISIEVPRYVELSLVPENAPHNPTSTSYLMDFGNMTSYQELAADLRIVGNVGFGVMMSSLNGGVLLNNPDSVAYQIKVGQGSYRSLSPAGSLHQVAQRNAGTNLEGERYNLRVKLGQLAQGLKGGEYQDVVTITIQAW